MRGAISLHHAVTGLSRRAIYRMVNRAEILKGKEPMNNPGGTRSGWAWTPDKFHAGPQGESIRRGGDRKLGRGTPDSAE